MSPNVPRRRQSAVVLGVFVVICRSGLAVNPALEINQYAHTAWTVHDGFFNGAINGISQDHGGYLLLATELGLLRFDGVRPPVPLTADEQIARGDTRTVFAASDGRIWIGKASGLSSLKDGQLTNYPELAGQRVLSILEDLRGTIWVAGYAIPTGRLCAFRDGKADCAGMAGEFARGATSLYQAQDGELWAGAANGLWRWRPTPPKHYLTSGAASSIRALAPGDGSLLIVMLDGIRQLLGGEVRPYPPLAKYESTPLSLLEDRNGGLWVGTDGQGLLHLHQGRVDRFTRSDGLSGNTVNSIFEDREGSIWAGTDAGVDRFRDFAAASISIKQGSPSAAVNAVLAARDGSIWIGTLNGLNRWKDGELTTYKRPGRPPVNDEARARVIFDAGLPDDNAQALFEDEQGRIWVCSLHGAAYFESGRLTRVSTEPDGFVSTIAGDRSGNLWVSDEYKGLTHYSSTQKIEQIPWAQLGKSDYASAMVAAPSRNGVWLGFRNGGVSLFSDGRLVKSYAAGEGLGQGAVNGLTLDADGTVWASTEGGLSHIRADAVMTLTTRNGLPCNAAQWMAESQDLSVWIYTACGLVRTDRSELRAWLSNPGYVLKVMTLEGSDGIISHSLTTASSAIGHVPGPSVAPDGKLWFSSINGASFVDPGHLPFNKLAPPVHIERIIGDHGVAVSRRLPARTRDLEIDYTALSLVAPEKNRFKYKLEGYDRGWVDAGNRRQAFYNNLGPRSYRFHVIASNNNGIWNETGDALEFSIEPAYYQTNWFRAACTAAFLALLWGLYQVRIQQISRQERQLRDVVETIPVATFTALPDGSNTFVSSRWTEYTGLSGEETAGEGWQKAIHPDDLERHAGKWRISIKTGQPFEDEARLRRASDGEYHWFLARGVPLRDRHGKILRWYGTLTDIEDRRTAEEALRRGEAYLAEAQKLTHTGSWVWDPHRDKMLFCSEEIYRVYGLDPRHGVPTFEELMQRVHPEDRDGVRKSTLELAHQEVEHLLEFRIVLPDGTVKYIQSVRRPVLNEAGDVVEVVGTSIDVTERKRVEAERERLYHLEADLAHINRVSMMGELTSSIAHEVNQPLAGIVSNASAGLRWLARDRPNLDEVREGLHRIVRDGKRAGEVIARVRALTKRTTAPAERLDPNELIREVLVLVADQAKKNSVSMQTRFADDVSPVAGDRVQLQQVVLNLVINAIEAMSTVDDRARELVITTRNTEPDHVQLTVADSGVGIDPEKIHQVFDSFYTTKPHGMGMGLSISHSIIQTHMGRLWATPNEGPGAAFHFTLPKYHEEEAHPRVATVS